MTETGITPNISLKEARVAILGTGLMGGSLAYALSSHCAALYGVDPDPRSRQLARQSGIFTEVCASLADLSSPVDVWILAAPVRAILSILADMPSWKDKGGIVLDVGSTKTRITAAMQALPERFDPIGGHPMCGKESGSFAHADKSIFQGAPFAWCRLERSSYRAVQLAEELCTVLDAHPLWLAAEVHDRWVAATSHLPYLVASALAVATPLEAAPLVGPGFRSATRVSGSSPEMMLDILLTNRTQVLEAAARFQQAFHDLVSFMGAAGAAELSDLETDLLLERLRTGRHNRLSLLGLEDNP